MAIMLFVAGVFMAVYSPWVQDQLRQTLLEIANKNEDIHLEIGSLRLKFPLSLSVGNVLMIQHGDTMIQAHEINADVAVLPLIGGEIELKRAFLKDARYQLGALDSASCMVIRSHNIEIDESFVTLSPMDIHVTKLSLDSAYVNMFINPADTFPVKPPTEPSPMNIKVDRVDFRKLSYQMQSMPTIWNLSADIESGGIDSIKVDVRAQTVNIGRFEGNNLEAEYIQPNARQLAETLVIVNPDKPVSPPWTIEIGTIDILDSKALYTTSGLKPLPGMDFGYIQVSHLDLLVHNFYNRASSIRLPFDVSAHERCGLNLKANGTLSIDSVGMTFENFGFSTETGTALVVDGYLNTVTPITDPHTPIRLATNGHIAVDDAETMFPGFSPYFKGLRKGAKVYLDINLEGTPGKLDIEKMNVRLDSHIKLAASGHIENLLNPETLEGDVRFQGDVVNISNWVGDLLAGTGVRIPEMTIGGDIKFRPNEYIGNVALKTAGGSMALVGSFSGDSERYNINMNAINLPVKAFMPELEIGNVTGRIQAEGQGIDPLNRSMNTNLDIDINSLVYKNTAYQNVKVNGSADLSYREGLYDVDLNVENIPVHAFVPDLGIGLVTGHIYANGEGLNPLSSPMTTNFEIDLNTLEYAHNAYHNVKASGTGTFSLKKELYNINFAVNNVPVNAFAPKFGVGPVTATIAAEGHGFNPFKGSFYTHTNIEVESVEYGGERLEGIKVLADIADGQADVCIDSYNPGLDVHLTAEGSLNNSRYVWDASLESSVLNLSKFSFLDIPAVVSAEIELHADVTPDLKNIDATIDITRFDYNTPEEDLNLDNSKIIVSLSETLSNIMIQNRDFYVTFSTPMSIESMMARVDKVGAQFKTQLKRHDIKITELQKTLMPFTLDVEAGQNNILSELLAAHDIHFEKLNILASNDSTLYLSANVADFEMNKFKFNDVNVDLRQEEEQINYSASVDNKPGTMDEYAHVKVDGYVKNGEIGLNLLQKNIEKKTGFEIGVTVGISPDSIATLHFTNFDPIVNYQQWHLNDNNFVSFDLRHHHLDADLMMKTDMSRILVYTEHARNDDHAVHDDEEDLIVQLFDIRIQDWLALNPFAPPIKGNVSAGLRLNWHDMALNGSGTVDIENLYYGPERIGDLNLDLGVTTDVTGLIKAEASMWYEDKKTLVLSGVLNDKDSDSPFDLDFSMIHFPLSMANAFIPEVAKLSGNLNGEMCITGDIEQPHINGYIAFEDAKVNVNMLGSAFTLNKDTIPVEDNLVRFNNFRILGVNENPLYINGKVDMRTIANPEVTLDLKANNMQIINTDRARNGAEIYGKAFVGLNATANGDLKVMKVDANVDILAGTNVTYILAGGTQALESQENSNMVKFVNFADTSAVAAADSIQIQGTILNLVADLNVNPGSIINVEIGTNAQDKVQIQGSGNFTYTSSPMGAGRMVGRYTLTGGFLKYAPPLISNLNFNFSEGSYVAFSGDITNPQLNIKAVEKMKANVSQAGQNSRLIYFDIILNVTGTPQNLNVAFNLETDDDVTVANELASMSPTQRASEAMNLLLYNTYTGGSTKATSNLNGNPLFSFLTNSVNSWLANNVKGVDLSIGVDQYDQTRNGNTSTTTAYSYQVSKSLLNDRLKIVVGGSYSDDPTENGNVAEELINDVSVEYFLNDARTMYFRLFRHTGYESILEGEITQTGVGFVYRKRINRISDMFVNPWRKYKKRREKEQKTQSNPLTVTDSVHHNSKDSVMTVNSMSR